MIGLLLTLSAFAGTITDARDVSVSVDSPQRMVVLGGGLTETVFGLGLGDQVVGVDAGSTFPSDASTRTQLGYHRQVSAEGVLALRPDLVIASEDSGPPAALAQLEAAGIPLAVLPSEASVQGAQQRIELLSDLLDRKAEGAELLGQLKQDLASVQAPSGAPSAVFIYARGVGALNVAGTETAAHAMLELAGAKPAVQGFEGYKPLTPEALVAAAPEVLVLTAHGLQSVGGIDGLLAVPGVALTPAGKNRRIVSVDDLLLLGFGPRTGQAAQTLAEALQ